MKRSLALALALLGCGGSSPSLPGFVQPDAAPPADAPPPDASPPDARPPDAAIAYGDPLTAPQTFRAGDVTVTAVVGTRLPIAGITVETIPGVPMIVRIGPAGADLAPPLQLEADVGAAPAIESGFAAVSGWDVTPRPADLSVTRTAAAREIVRGRVARLGDLSFTKSAAPLLARVDSPLPQSRVEAPFAATVSVKNAHPQRDLSTATAAALGSGPLMKLAETPVTVSLFPGQLDAASLGTYRCTTRGPASLLITTTATAAGLPTYVLERRADVACVDVYATLTTTAESASVTAYAVDLFVDDGTTARKITADPGVLFGFELEATCGTLVDRAGAGKKAYQHSGCAGSQTAVLTVTVAVDVVDLAALEFHTSQFARQGEGQEPVEFR